MLRYFIQKDEDKKGVVIPVNGISFNIPASIIIVWIENNSPIDKASEDK